MQDGVTGLIVPEQDVQALSAALTIMMTDETLRMEMSEAALKIMLQWSSREMMDGFDQAMQYALATYSRVKPRDSVTNQVQ